MEDARKALEKFLIETKAARIADDLPALASYPENGDQVTDEYLAALAGRHKYKMATLSRNSTRGRRAYRAARNSHTIATHISF
jgi:hypothetical protein